jgi:alpha-glucosidase
VLWHLIKDSQWRSNPPNPQFGPGQPPHQAQIPLYTADRPEVQQVVAELRRVVNEFEDRVLIGEIYLPVERLVAYYGANLDGVHLPFNFQLLQASWNARSLSRLIDQYDRAIPHGGWPNWVLGNHDNPRIASKLGLPQARIAAMLLLTLRGTPTMYYGDELGMLNVPIPADRVQDPFERNVPGIGVGRDPSRTPMQWDGSEYAGFSAAEPWLPLSNDHATVNVRAQEHDPASMLTLYRRLLALRQKHEALCVGDYEELAMSGDMIAYIRRSSGGDAFLIALNLGNEPRSFSLEPLGLKGRVALSTHLDAAEGLPASEVALRRDEGVIVELS